MDHFGHFRKGIDIAFVDDKMRFMGTKLDQKWAAELLANPTREGVAALKSEVERLEAQVDTLSEVLASTEDCRRALTDAIRGLSKVKDGKTLFEGSPIKDPECCAAWEALNAAMQKSGHIAKFPHK